ncbi:MAG: BtpA/SgcQ family protein [Aphanocapsa feldmannii 277cV]|uniref:BtpA/SgcQ family protein n=2 Tax=Aphanocapsa feldmannii TaxID=192050 RepID=A0A524RQ12_9CHRO|nr:MAG: BtpA/SgcQ family protein [Aphanocapsa feldmannii 277cV]TGH25067.1 MAG: BtpA/SgcQ family protein [Aphanocapsa feldmannii 277cI]
MTHQALARWRGLFPQRCPLIGVLHLPALPGSPDWSGELGAVEAFALADTEAYLAGGAAALVVENFGDHPFFPERVPAETVAAMARIASRVVERAGRLPVGINVLRNDGLAALAVALASGARFIRVNVLSGVMATDQGLIQGRAAELMRRRRLLGAEDVLVLGDVLVKHALPLAARTMADVVKDTLLRARADGVIVSGVATGSAASPADLAAARQAAGGAPVLLGSGVSSGNATNLCPGCDGVIVASALKEGGVVSAPVDAARVRVLRQLLDALPPQATDQGLVA